ncbi:MAG: flagellar basal body-associated FliL family protein [Alphaproteobacteria bacterium]
MKMLLIGLVSLAIIGGGGAGAYFYFMKPAEAVSKDGGTEHKDKHASKKEDDDYKKKAGKYEYVELSPLILPIIDENGVNQVVSMVVAIEVKNSKDATTVTTLSPRLKDAYIQQMYGMLNRHAAFKGGVLQVNEIKKKLNEISDKVLGEDLVQDVLLQVVQQRPV